MFRIQLLLVRLMPGWYLGRKLIGPGTDGELLRWMLRMLGMLLVLVLVLMLLRLLLLNLTRITRYGRGCGGVLMRKSPGWMRSGWRMRKRRQSLMLLLR